MISDIQNTNYSENYSILRNDGEVYNNHSYDFQQNDDFITLFNFANSSYNNDFKKDIAIQSINQEFQNKLPDLHLKQDNSRKTTRKTTNSEDTKNAKGLTSVSTPNINELNNSKEGLQINKEKISKGSNSQHLPDIKKLNKEVKNRENTFGFNNKSKETSHLFKAKDMTVSISQKSKNAHKIKLSQLNNSEGQSRQSITENKSSVKTEKDGQTMTKGSKFNINTIKNQIIPEHLKNYIDKSGLNIKSIKIQREIKNSGQSIDNRHPQILENNKSDFSKSQMEMQNFTSLHKNKLINKTDDNSFTIGISKTNQFVNEVSKFTSIFSSNIKAKSIKTKNSRKDSRASDTAEKDANISRMNNSKTQKDDNSIKKQELVTNTNTIKTKASNKNSHNSLFDNVSILNKNNVQVTNNISANSNITETYNDIKLEDIYKTTMKIANSTVNNSTSSARLLLKPESLGTVFVKIQIRNGLIKIKFDVETKEVIKNIEQQIGLLKEQLNKNGMKTETIDINLRHKEESLFAKDKQNNKWQDRNDKKSLKNFINSFKFLKNSEIEEI